MKGRTHLTLSGAGRGEAPRARAAVGPIETLTAQRRLGEGGKGHTEVRQRSYRSQRSHRGHATDRGHRANAAHTEVKQLAKVTQSSFRGHSEVTDTEVTELLQLAQRSYSLQRSQKGQTEVRPEPYRGHTKAGEGRLTFTVTLQKRLQPSVGTRTPRMLSLKTQPLANISCVARRGHH